MQKSIPDYYNNLDKIYIKIWNLLNSGSINRDSPFHLPVFICGTNKQFDGRTVVLRGADEKNKILWFHTDIRSKKIKILENNSQASLLFYDKIEKIQLRVLEKTRINYQNNITEIAWKKTAHISRQCYLGKEVPGNTASNPNSGLSKKFDNFEYSLQESEIGYKNFCLIETFINSVEWLYLAAKGHRRAQFILKNDSVEKKWLIP